MTAPTASETLNKAADLIEERGWGQGPIGWGSFAGRSRLCLEGGLLAALEMDWVTVNLGEFADCPSYRAVVDYLGHAGPLHHWNDDDSRAAALIEAAKEDAAVVAHLIHHAVDIIAAELDQTAPLAEGVTA